MKSCVLGVLDVAVPLGFAFQGVASKLCFRDKSQLKWRFWWMGVCSKRVEIIPNVSALRYGSPIFVAGAGNREVATCDGGDIAS